MTNPPDPDSLDVDRTEISPASQPHGDSTSPQIHNSETNSAVAQENLCGMTHLASGGICRLPARHPGSCEFIAEATSS
jgi:hypothetical protein